VLEQSSISLRGGAVKLCSAALGQRDRRRQPYGSIFMRCFLGVRTNSPKRRLGATPGKGARFRLLAGQGPLGNAHTGQGDVVGRLQQQEAGAEQPVMASPGRFRFVQLP
jgi:hypothetical protein